MSEREIYDLSDFRYLPPSCIKKSFGVEAPPPPPRKKKQTKKTTNTKKMLWNHHFRQHVTIACKMLITKTSWKQSTKKFEQFLEMVPWTISSHPCGRMSRWSCFLKIVYLATYTGGQSVYKRFFVVFSSKIPILLLLYVFIFAF